MRTRTCVDVSGYMALMVKWGGTRRRGCSQSFTTWSVMGAYRVSWYISCLIEFSKWHHYSLQDNCWRKEMILTSKNFTKMILMLFCKWRKSSKTNLIMIAYSKLMIRLLGIFSYLIMITKPPQFQCPFSGINPPVNQTSQWRNEVSQLHTAWLSIFNRCCNLNRKFKKMKLYIQMIQGLWIGFTRRRMMTN